MIRTVSRRKMIKYSLLSGLSLGVSSCALFFTQKVTSAMINLAVVQLLKAWAAVNKNSVKTSAAVDVAYQGLKKSIVSRDVAPSMVADMESTKNSLSTQASSLKKSVEDTRSNANNLFYLLESRANENSSNDLKGKMLELIKSKRDKFSEKVKIAEDVMSKLEKSIKKYDDILGYFQVSSQLNTIDKYITDIDAVIAEAVVLNGSVQSAVADGNTIIKSVSIASSY
jgi:hypothetical protein